MFSSLSIGRHPSLSRISPSLPAGSPNPGLSGRPRRWPDTSPACISRMIRPRSSRKRRVVIESLEYGQPTYSALVHLVWLVLLLGLTVSLPAPKKPLLLGEPNRAASLARRQWWRTPQRAKPPPPEPPAPLHRSLYRWASDHRLALIEVCASGPDAPTRVGCSITFRTQWPSRCRLRASCSPSASFAAASRSGRPSSNPSAAGSRVHSATRSLCSVYPRASSSSRGWSPGTGTGTDGGASPCCSASKRRQRSEVQRSEVQLRLGGPRLETGRSRRASRRSRPCPSATAAPRHLDHASSRAARCAWAR